MAAAGRWLGVILSDRGPDRPPLRDSERYLLWTLGKTAALAAFARQATNKQAQARQLQERMDLAREVHESVIQRLFGIQLVFSSMAELTPAARERIAAELQAALADLRRALQRPLSRSAPETQTTLLEEVERLRREHRDLHLTLREGSEQVRVPPELEPLAQSVLAEAVRNAHKHAGPSKVEVSLERQGRRHARARRDQRRRPRQGAPARHGPQAGGAGGVAGGRDRGVRRARAGDMARADGGAA